MYFFDLDLTDVTPPATKIKMPKRKGQIIHADLGSILSWVITGQLGNYRYNRGLGKIAQKTAESARSGVHSDSIGELTIGLNEDKWCMSDWHSRLYGFLQRYMDGAMTTVELKTKVSVRCTHDFIESYQDLGNAAPHRTKDKIQNPHLLYGCIWNRIMQPLEEEVVRLVGSNKWTVFSSVVYALNETEIDSDEWNWPDIYMNRGPAGRLANLLAGDSVFSHFNKNHTHFEDMFASAIRYWHEMVVELQQKAGVMNISKIRSSAGLFGFIVVSHMRGSLPTRPKTASSRILARISDMSRICPELCRGDKVDIIKYCRQLKKVLY